ncbi:MAG: DNA polymerase, partial [Bacteroidota bacterium]|nr:DNA polymerase [Bacteroidota bacterium]
NLISDFPRSFWLKELQGGNYYRYVCAFKRLSDMWDAVRFVLEKINRTSQKKFESYTEAEHIHFKPDTNTQYLIQSGKTLFKEMQFSDLHRMQFDIETYSRSYKFSNAGRSEDRIILITLSDNRGWERVLGGKNISEPALLEECVHVIREKDPDVIEGHNIFNFDLPYVLQRCQLHNIEFSVGRDGSPPHAFSMRSPFSERETEYQNFEIAGRHIIDTLLLLQAYDVSKRNLESYGLKYAARYFGIATPDRVYIPGEQISWYWDHEPDTLKRYALDDVRETRALADRLSMSTFFLTQMLPFNYGTLARTGSTAKIESLFLREYLRKRHSLPKPEAGVQTTGGFTAIYYTGVLGPAVHADVESLYPSIMLSKKLSPASDVLNTFQKALRHLTKLRLDTKRKMQTSADEAERMQLDAAQSSFKILINSFYGYLGYSKGLFNDYAKADIVTTTGQELLKQLIREIELFNGTVIEVDTDGIYFQPPDNVKGEDEERRFVETLSSRLPEGIHLGFDGRYKKILSYKKKNYALLGYDNKITVKGSSLISRSMERFGRSFIRQAIDCLLNNRIQELHTLYLEIERSLHEHSLDVRDFARTETLKDSLKEYERDVANQKRNRTAGYELALQSSETFRTGDRISYYITGNDANIKGFENAKEASAWDPNFPDENVAYYLKRLGEFAAKFEPFFSEQNFHAVFSSEGLFGFDAASVAILTRKVQTDENEKHEWENPEPTISLDN